MSASQFLHSRFKNRFSFSDTLRIFSYLLLIGIPLQPLKAGESIAVDSLSIDPMNLSGMIIQDNWMAIVSDESNQIAILKREQHTWRQSHLINLSDQADEIDLEALGFDAPYLYALGSHSSKRSRLKERLTQNKNRQRQQQRSDEPARKQLFRVHINPNLKAGKIESISLQSLIEQDPVVGLFSKIPSKENGVDLEGLSLDQKGRLLIGFRGPVLRGNMTPVLRLKLEKSTFKVKKSKWLWLDLEGRGLRGMSPLDAGIGGQLLLAGPVGDQSVDYGIYYWDESDQLTGKDRDDKGLRLICNLSPNQGKPESIQFIGRQQKQIDFFILHDGIRGGGLSRRSCPFPMP
ncbi:DUF3616 domain-containing protein [Thiomicrorhabdus sp.]|uniref:DUF3616 domain-containing protein n=1 Tax=Thiomicrorhabdus sp. TaxID=2039724 RepID=UPI0029C6709F|nr:DUF3616 domain-containing protein [Thiomicrorhabdus sp.]